MGTLYTFDEFIFDSVRRSLHRGDLEIDLPESAALVLECLVDRAPDAVDKEILIDAAWPGTAVVPDNLVQAIHALRSALGGDAKRPKFIQTVHRRGYRFVCPVERVESADDLPPVAPLEVIEESRAWSRRQLGGLALGLAVVLLIIGAVTTALSRWNGADRPRVVRSLAVLPLDNLSGDPEQEFFADGMTDLLITELARFESLDVISRTSVMRFKDTQESLPEIADELGVDAVVEGTITRDGDRIRVIAQLVDDEDRHIWGESYEYLYSDVLQLQRDFALAIAREIGARIDPERASTANSLVDPAAYEAVLRGRHLVRARTHEAILLARDLFQEAISIDPDFASAYGGLAYVYNLLANYGFEPSPVARPLAREAAERALELDPDLAEAHQALAMVAYEYDWDFEVADREYAIALSLQPSSAETRSWYANLLLAMDKKKRAIEEMRHARRLDPLSPIVSSNLGWVLFVDDQVEEAEKQLLEVIGYQPDFAVAHFYLGLLYDRQNRFDEAIASLEDAVRCSNRSSYAVAALSRSMARSGDEEQAQGLLDELLSRRKEAYVSPVGLAVAHFGLGRVDEAFAYLEEAYTERKGWLMHIRVEPALDGHRDDPRYLDLVRRIGLPDPVG